MIQISLSYLVKFRGGSAIQPPLVREVQLGLSVLLHQHPALWGLGQAVAHLFDSACMCVCVVVYKVYVQMGISVSY